METSVDYRAVAAGQHGLVTRAQLLESEVSRAARRRLVDRGDLVPVGRQVFRISGAPVTEHQAILAACLDVGGVASHRTAAWLHHLIAGRRRAGPPEVMVRRPGGHHNPNAVVHSTTFLPPDDVVTVDGIPCLGVPRTLLTLAALVPHELTYDEVKGAVDEAIRVGIAHERWLWWRLEKLRRSGRNGVRVFEQILEARAAGEVTESWLERETLQVLVGAGLPAPVCQARIERKGSFLGRVDFLYAAARLVIEVSGYRWHRTAEQAAADAERRRRLTLAGFTVLEYTFHEVVSSPDLLVAEVAEALGRARAA
ncbi:MAG: type IV toxin-antitoxin system AbiEi family antitoxin domain-containing protein [Acidimicrobiales bacterium]